MAQEVLPETRRSIRRWCAQAGLGLPGYGLALFLAAGSVAWLWGWVLLAVLTAFLAAHPLILVRRNPELLAEREKGLRDNGVKEWDRWIAAAASGVMPVASWVVAGLEFRFHWTAPSPLVSHLSGLLSMLLGYCLFLWAMASNAFFAEGVRIQKERGHTVATSGPYRYVRHPGYLGAILAQLATPLLLGSCWAWIPSAASASLYVLRTYLEDRTLTQELQGYLEYGQRSRYRLLPGIW